MQALRVGKGYSAIWTVTLRDEDGVPVAGTYDGSEPLALVVASDDGLPWDFALSGAEWLDPAAGTLTLTLDGSETAGLTAQPRGLSINVEINGRTFEAYHAILRVEPRAH